MMNFIRLSNDKTVLSFDVKKDSSFFDASSFKRVPVFIRFNNVPQKDQQKFEDSKVIYFRKLSGDVSCLVDRFDCFPL